MISVGDANERGDIVRRESFEIAQHDDLALAIRQLRQQLLNASGEVLGHEVVVGAVGPRLGRSDPRPGSVEALVDRCPRGVRRAAPGPTVDRARLSRM